MNNERYVLGAMLQWEECLLAGLPSLSEECFTSPQRMQVYSTICMMHERKIKLSISLIGSIFANDILLEAMECESVAVSSQSFQTHLAMLEQETALRKLRVMLHESIRDIDGKMLENPIGDIQAKINNLALSYIKAKEYSHPDSVMEWVGSLNVIKKDVGAIRTPWARMNRYLGGGLYRGRTYVLGGLKKTGKSRLSCHLSSGILDDENGIVWFSMEMPPSDIHTCIMACRAEVDTANIHSKSIRDVDLNRLTMHSQYYINQDLYIFKNSGITPDFVASGIRSRKQKQKVDVVFVDYIQRMKGKKTNNRADELEDIANRLSDIAREENVALVILSQLSGTAEDKASGIPVYGKFKGSHGILESADVGIVLTDLNRGEEVEEGQNYRDIDAVLVQRAGESDVVVQFKAYLKHSKFEETERPRIEKANKGRKRSSF